MHTTVSLHASMPGVIVEPLLCKHIYMHACKMCMAKSVVLMACGLLFLFNIQVDIKCEFYMCVYNYAGRSKLHLSPMQPLSDQEVQVTNVKRLRGSDNDSQPQNVCRFLKFVLIIMH